MSYKSIPLISVAKIIHETVKPFDGEKYYMATGDLSNENTKELEFVSYANRPSRADLTTKKGDVILARMKSTNKVLIVQDLEANYIYSTGFIILRPTREVDNNFLLHYLQSTLFQDEKDKLCTGATQKAINNQNFANLEIPLPSLPIQQRIAEILDAADALRRKDQELLNKYDELAQAIFIDMFGDPVKNEKGWEVKTIGDVCYSVKDGPHVSPKYTKSGIPFISVNNIIKGVIDISNCKYISQEDFEIYSKNGKPEKHDILYTKGGTTGFAKRVDVDFEFSQWVHVALLKFNHDVINPAFFEYMLNNPFCYNQSQVRTKGIANRDLVLGEMKKIQILLPPIQKQREFESIILLLDQARKRNFESIGNSSDLFASLLQQAFKGELIK